MLGLDEDAELVGKAVFVDMAGDRSKVPWLGELPWKASDAGFVSCCCCCC